MKDSSPVLRNGPSQSPATVALAHGAGAPMDSPFMNSIALGLAAKNLQVLRFEFPYMAERRHGASKRPPNPASVLVSCWRSAIQQMASHKNLFIGGKSLGGRIASMLADDVSAKGVVMLGYPFHPIGKSEKIRTSHLETLRTPGLILQGERDPLGNRTDVTQYKLSPSINIRWLTDGDHSFKPRKKSGITEEHNRQTAIKEIISFVNSILGNKPA